MKRDYMKALIVFTVGFSLKMNDMLSSIVLLQKKFGHTCHLLENGFRILP